MLFGKLKVRGENESLRGGIEPPERESELRHHNTCIAESLPHRIGDPRQVLGRVRE
jgi:hypothetical protein